PRRLQRAAGELLSRFPDRSPLPRLDRSATGTGVHHVPHGPDRAGASHALCRGASRMIGVSVIGLGNGFPPHAQGLLDLKHRVRVVRAAARDTAHTKIAAETYGFPV